MAKKNNTIFWIIGIVVVVLLVGPQLELFVIGEASMTRSIPSTVSPGSSFTVIYKVLGVSGKYGVSVVDTVSGGCTPSGEHMFVIADDTSYKTSESFTYTAPSSGSCTFSGDYKFGTEAIKNFADKTITISANGNGNGNGYVHHHSYNCYDNDVYWYDSDGIRNDKKEDCGTLGCSGGICIIDGNGNGGFDLNKVLFNIGNFEVTILILLISFGAVLLLLLFKK